MSSLCLYFFTDLPNLIEMLTFIFSEYRQIEFYQLLDLTVTESNNWFLVRAQAWFLLSKWFKPEFLDISLSSFLYMNLCFISIAYGFCPWFFTWVQCFQLDEFSPRRERIICFAWLVLHNPPPCHYYTLICYVSIIGNIYKQMTY